MNTAEAQFTWQNIYGWFDFADLYEEAVAKAPSGGVLVEVGTWLGRSLCYLGQLARRADKGLSVVGVDNCTGSRGEPGLVRQVENRGGTLAGELHQNIIKCGLQDVVSVLIADSVTAAKLFQRNTLSFCFIDGDHEVESVCRDLYAWSPKVGHGCILAGHDYEKPSVRAAVHQVLVHPKPRPCSRNSWRWDKPS